MLKRRKRLAAVLLAATVCVAKVSAGGIAVSAEEEQGQMGVESTERQSEGEGERGETEDYIYYVLENGTVEISKYKGSGGNVIIPSQIEGKDVTRIDEGGFYTIDNLVSVTIPGTVKSIGNKAFYSCEELSSVTLAEGLEIIEEDAFCQCRKLGSITLPESVTSIERGAFVNCDLLSGITVPKGVVSIAPYAFGGSREVEINVSPENSHYASVDGCLYNKDKTTILECDKELEEGALPASVTSIGRSAFCNSMTSSLMLPEGLVSIEDYAFYNSNIYAITITKNVASIGKGAFAGLSEINVSPENSHYVCVGGCLYNRGKTEILACAQSVTEVVLPEGLTNICDNAFMECRELTSVTLPNSLENIGNNAFYDCSRLSSITFSEGLKNIGNYAFKACSHLSSITLPEGLENIGISAFSASGLSSITVPESVVSIGYDAFEDCEDLTVNQKKGSYYEYSLLEDEAVEIEKYHGSDGTISVPAVIAGRKVQGIGWGAFKDCSSLNSITLPEGLVSIDEIAFYGCSSLSSVILPEGLVRIGCYTFLCF